MPGPSPDLSVLNHIVAETWMAGRSPAITFESGGSPALRLALRLPLGLEHGGVERLARRLSRPDHELERRKVALAGIERGGEQCLALPAGGFDAAGEHQRMAIHDQAVLDPEVEVSDPHLFVDQRDQLLHLAAAALRHLELEGAGEMQRLDVEHPGVGDLVVGPFAGHQNGDLVLARALERPAVGRGHPLDHFEGIGQNRLDCVDEGHARLHPAARMWDAHSTVALLTRPRWSALPAPGRITWRVEYNPTDSSG